MKSEFALHSCAVCKGENFGICAVCRGENFGIYAVLRGKTSGFVQFREEKLRDLCSLIG